MNKIDLRKKSNIEWGVVSSNIDVTIVDVYGKTVMQKTTPRTVVPSGQSSAAQINIESLSNGIYTVKIKDAESTVACYKIVKN